MTSGRHFLQIPGPTNVPERVLRAMDRPVPDHRGPEMPALVGEIVEGLRRVFGTRDGEIALFPGSGTGAWEAALVNTLSPGDRVLACNTGHFPYTPATLLLFGMREALRMLREEGLDNVYARHASLAEGVRRAVRAWELPILCRRPEEYSHTLTAVVMPEGSDSGRVLRVAS